MPDTPPQLASTMTIVVLSQASVPSDSGNSVGNVAAETEIRSTMVLANLGAGFIHRSKDSVHSRISDCAQQGVGFLARVQPGVLDHHRHVGFDDAGEFGSLWNRLWRLKVVESDVLGPSRWHRDFVGPNGLLVGKENQDTHVGILIARVQYARG